MSSNDDDDDDVYDDESNRVKIIGEDLHWLLYYYTYNILPKFNRDYYDAIGEGHWCAKEFKQIIENIINNNLDRDLTANEVNLIWNWLTHTVSVNPISRKIKFIKSNAAASSLNKWLFNDRVYYFTKEELHRLIFLFITWYEEAYKNKFFHIDYIKIRDIGNYTGKLIELILKILEYNNNLVFDDLDLENLCIKPVEKNSFDQGSDSDSDSGSSTPKIENSLSAFSHEEQQEKKVEDFLFKFASERAKPKKKKIKKDIIEIYKNIFFKYFKNWVKDIKDIKKQLKIDYEYARDLMEVWKFYSLKKKYFPFENWNKQIHDYKKIMKSAYMFFENDYLDSDEDPNSTIVEERNIARLRNSIDNFIGFFNKKKQIKLKLYDKKSEFSNFLQKSADLFNYYSFLDTKRLDESYDDEKKKIYDYLKIGYEMGYCHQLKIFC